MEASGKRFFENHGFPSSMWVSGFIKTKDDTTVKMPEKSSISCIFAKSLRVPCKLNAGFRHDPF